MKLNWEKLNWEEGIGGLGSMLIAGTTTLEASKSVFIDGKPAVTMAASSPELFYFGWLLVVTCFVLKTLDIKLAERFNK